MMLHSSSEQMQGYGWLILYFFCNLTLTIYNKFVMQVTGFSYPWTLTAIHTLFSALGCYVSVYWFNACEPAVLNQQENYVMMAFSVLYTVNIAVSNISLNMVTVPFHQVVRATTPVFTIAMNVLYLQKTYDSNVYLSLLPVILGVALATLGDYDYTALGFFLTLLGTFLAALKTIVTNVVQVGKLKLHPLDLLLRMSPSAFVQCILFSMMSGEIADVLTFYHTKMSYQVFWALFFNGFIAFVLNFVSFTANKKTSALTMTVAANVKQVLSIVLAVFVFNLTVTATNAFGILLTIFGGAWYAKLELEMKSKHSSSVAQQKQQTEGFLDSSKIAATTVADSQNNSNAIVLKVEK